MKNYKTIVFLLSSFVFYNCQTKVEEGLTDYMKLQENILDYSITPSHKFDKSGLMFSDQGAWFAYGIPDSINTIGFTGPFLMTQQNGVWISQNIADLIVKDVIWTTHKSNSYTSHLTQVFTSKNLELSQELVFKSGHTALLRSTFKNTSNKKITLTYYWKNQPILADGLRLSANDHEIEIRSSKTNAIGHLHFPEATRMVDESNYITEARSIEISPSETYIMEVSQTFIFPEYDWNMEKKHILKQNFEELLQKRVREKSNQTKTLIGKRKDQFKDSIYDYVLAKAQLTLQNNWRIPAGEIKHEGLFPSYHYKWFHGFWSWDSWKHAVGLSNYDISLAKKQIKLMFDFQNDDGFVADVVYRDTTIEAHNYRDTKPPLAAWAVYEIYKKDYDLDFVKYMYPKLKKYHEWWYAKRDHDQDGLCEYGSTDGSLIAAKWESGMDNAIRFDHSKILKNGEGAFSLDQESVDLNAYLYAEKLFLAKLSEALNIPDEVSYLKEAATLKEKIQAQFYDPHDGWFYDTNLEGTQFIKGEGSEGWTALWAEAVTFEQAEKVKNRMMTPSKFFTKVPFQTMSADHPKFDPLKGYWRGPNWLDQAYFGVKGLRNYGYNHEADKATKQIFQGAEGLLVKGKSIRENYHPLNGQGLHAKNFSWSAAHVLLLLLKE